MRLQSSLTAGLRQIALKSGLARLRKNQDGTTAIEFAIVAIPFLMFVCGLMGVASYFFITTSLEKGMDRESRLIRTGQAALSNLTVNEFKAGLCKEAGSWVKCNKVQVFVQKFADWASVAPSRASRPTVRKSSTPQTAAISSPSIRVVPTTSFW